MRIRQINLFIALSTQQSPFSCLTVEIALSFQRQEHWTCSNGNITSHNIIPNPITPNQHTLSFMVCHVMVCHVLTLLKRCYISTYFLSTVLSHAFETSFLLAVWSCHMIKDKTLRWITIIMSHTVEWLLVVACIELSSVRTDRPAKLNATTTHEQMAQKYQTELTMAFN